MRPAWKSGPLRGPATAQIVALPLVSAETSGLAVPRRAANRLGNQQMIRWRWISRDELAMDFASAAYDLPDAFAANEFYQDHGWTDGLPIVPPTDTLVRAFLEAARMAPSDVVGVEPVRRRRITAEKVAIAAVMAGCRPEYMPVALAVVRALCDTAYGLHGGSAWTRAAAPFTHVSGPIW